jgi:hypothetical protein
MPGVSPLLTSAQRAFVQRLGATAGLADEGHLWSYARSGSTYVLTDGDHTLDPLSKADFEGLAALGYLCIDPSSKTVRFLAKARLDRRAEIVSRARREYRLALWTTVASVVLVVGAILYVTLRLSADSDVITVTGGLVAIGCPAVAATCERWRRGSLTALRAAEQTRDDVEPR